MYFQELPTWHAHDICKEMFMKYKNIIIIYITRNLIILCDNDIIIIINIKEKCIFQKVGVFFMT